MAAYKNPSRFKIWSILQTIAMSIWPQQPWVLWLFPWIRQMSQLFPPMTQTPLRLTRKRAKQYEQNTN